MHAVKIQDVLFCRDFNDRSDQSGDLYSSSKPQNHVPYVYGEGIVSTLES